MAVKILAVFFIGGASSCASLMSCREFDGGLRSAKQGFQLLIIAASCCLSTYVKG